LINQIIGDKDKAIFANRQTKMRFSAIFYKTKRGEHSLLASFVKKLN
jgi:hypothetical protein